MFAEAETLHLYHSELKGVPLLFDCDESKTNVFIHAPETLLNEHPQFTWDTSEAIVKVATQTLLIKLSNTNTVANCPKQVNQAKPEQRKQNIQENTNENQQVYWLKLTYQHSQPSWLDGDKPITEPSADTISVSHFERLLATAEQLKNVVLEYLALSSDPLTMLCSRSVLQTKIAALIEQNSVGLVMLHCTDFNQINRKFGHEYGDKVIQEIATNLKAVTRDTDILSRFSGALFGLAFNVFEQDDVTAIAKNLQKSLQHNQYLDGAINLTFNLGAAVITLKESFKSDTERASTLINRADQALTAAQQEKIPSIITWTNDDFSLHQQQFNYLGGIFTADTVTDYRNMLLLWDISSLIADKHEFSHLLQSVVQRLAQTFEFLNAGIISAEPQTNKALLYSINDQDLAVPLTQQDQQLLPVLHQMQTGVEASSKPSERYMGDNLVLVLPLKIDSPDCFFISGVASKFQVKHDTKVLLSGLIRQLGKALRRSRLEEELNRKLESHNEQLQNELTTLKEGLQESNIIFQSSIMHSLMKHAKRAAMTDTTVLVTGESGTGKERLIHALHTLGPRANKALVIVDCGSIPETLIESELFGYIKGAFTGAQNSSKGKIADAQGGVLVLDEIGELPLQMQTKLLRFVQEKHYTPVGGNKLIDIDVKIIAVTNRDLATEVEKGTFRRDLYYRLNVLTLHNPPLRERAEDITLLSTHFLKRFAEQFSTNKKMLSEQAAKHMQQYAWPGNIRELENRLMQATLMCEGDVIEWELLNVLSNTVATPPNTTQENKHLPEPDYFPPPIDTVQPASAIVASHSEVNSISMDKPSTLANLTGVLKQCFQSSDQSSQLFNAPIGQWIEDDLILQTFVQSGEKMRTTAARLHISQSKARRRVDKILADQSEQNQYRPANWHDIQQALLPISSGNVVIDECLIEVKLSVMQVILSLDNLNMAQAAEMLGVSEPTFYKLKRRLPQY
jgi:diguanylate cyclase (GGDEF)-like protein